MGGACGAHRRRRLSHPHDALRRPRRSRRGRRRGRAGRAEVRHPHRSRRRHAPTRSARIHRRRARARWRRDQHRRGALCRDRHAARAVSARRRSRRGGRGRPPARRLRHRGASRFAQAALRWTDDRAPIDGLEWLNTDSEWREESRFGIARAGLAYFLRPGPALATLFDRPATLDRWDRLTSVRPVVSLAGADAHGGVGRRAEDTGRSLSGMIGMPSYEAASARSATACPRPAAVRHGGRGRPRRARRDPEGRVFTAIDAIAGPALLDFHIEAGLERTHGRADAGRLRRHHRRPGPPSSRWRVDPSSQRKGGGRGGSTDSTDRHRSARAYRVEVAGARRAGLAAVPWLVSNPIYFARQDFGHSTGSGAATGAAPPSAIPFPWRIEKDPASSGIVRTSAHEAALEYKLAAGAPNSQFVALATDPGPQVYRTIELSLAGDRPLRVSVQIGRRAAGGGEIVYVDPAGSILGFRCPASGRSTGPPASRLPPTSLRSCWPDLTNAARGVPGSCGCDLVL